MNQGYIELQQGYKTWLDTLGFSDSVVYDYNFRIRDFFEWLETQGVNRITTLTGQHVARYFTYLQHRPNKRRAGGLSASGLNDNYNAVDKFLEFLHAMGMQNAPVPTNYRAPVDQQARLRSIVPFSADEIKELQALIPDTLPELPFTEREARHEQLRLIFALYYGCGLRKSEGYRLAIQDIDFERRTVFVRQGKNYKDRFVPMNTGVYKILEHYVYNFRNLQNTKHKRLFLFSPSTIDRDLKNLQQLSENPSITNKRLTLHILRHSIATNLLQNGMSLENIARFLGHSSLESTQIYTHIVQRKLAQE